MRGNGARCRNTRSRCSRALGVRQRLNAVRRCICTWSLLPPWPRGSATAIATCKFARQLFGGAVAMPHKRHHKLYRFLENLAAERCAPTRPSRSTEARRPVQPPHPATGDGPFAGKPRQLIGPSVPVVQGPRLSRLRLSRNVRRQGEPPWRTACMYQYTSTGAFTSLEHWKSR
jgi:hypothetical protein